MAAVYREPADCLCDGTPVEGRHRQPRDAESVEGKENDLGVGVPAEPPRQRAVDLQGRCHDAKRGRGAGGRHRHRDRLIQLIAGRTRLYPQPGGGLSFHRATDERATGEVFVEEVALGCPGLEHSGAIGDQHPVGARSGPAARRPGRAGRHDHRSAVTHRCGRRRPEPGPALP